MRIRPLLVYIAVALPALVLAGVGVTHPIYLTASTAEYWRNLHIAILPIFPLLGFAPWLVVRGFSLAISWVVGILGFLYAAFYTGLDVLAGIGAGGVKLDGMGMATGTLFGLGRDVGAVGSVAFIAAVTIVSVVTVARAGVSALPGSVLVIAGSVFFYLRHIYFPVGVIGQLCLALGWVLLLLALRARAKRDDVVSSTPTAR